MTEFGPWLIPEVCFISVSLGIGLFTVKECCSEAIFRFSDNSSFCSVQILLYCLQIQISYLQLTQTHTDYTPGRKYIGGLQFLPFLLLCLSVYKLFFRQDFSATTWVRILKFGTKLDSEKLYCVTKNSHILLIRSFICSFFFLSNEIFCKESI